MTAPQAAGPFREIPLAQLPVYAPTQPSSSAALGAVPPVPVQLAMPPSLPPLPADPLDALLRGLHLPALPGVDQLLAPVNSLASSFGSGHFGALNPPFVLKRGAALLDTAMTASHGALRTLDSVWKGQTGEKATDAGRNGIQGGDRVGAQGADIAVITQQAAGVVARGNAELTAIAQSFASTAVAAAPVLFTPPGLAMLLRSASEHLTEAIAVVTRTQTALGAFGAQLAAAGSLIRLPSLAGLDPFEIADQALTGVITPMAKWMSETITEAATQPQADQKTTQLPDKAADSGLPGAHTDPSTPGSTTAAAAGQPSGGHEQAGVAKTPASPSLFTTETPHAPGRNLAAGTAAAAGGAPLGAALPPALSARRDAGATTRSASIGRSTNNIPRQAESTYDRLDRLLDPSAFPIGASPLR